MKHAAELQHGDVIFTHRQTAGRGQQGRVWYAPAGVMTASFVMDRLPLVGLPGLSLAAGIAVIRAVEELLPNLQNVLQIKWPNDVLIQQHKLAGVLCETTSRSSAARTRVVVGVGLNRAVDFAQVGLDQATVGNAISLHEVAPPPDELLLLERLRYHLLQVSEKFINAEIDRNSKAETHLTEFLPELRQRDALLGHTITLQQADTSFSGQAMGIDAEGRLILQLPDRRVHVSSGHVLW
jgi:BirA family biotin operon repressor/biotin-[acetyl-CoA-carboxylase] ligase